jgi:excisionase family DNA binding protein
MMSATTERHEMLLTVPEAAKRLRCSYPTALALIHRGQLPAAKVGRAYLVRPEAIGEALRRLEAATAT